MALGVLIWLLMEEISSLQVNHFFGWKDHENCAKFDGEFTGKMWLFGLALGHESWGKEFAVHGLSASRVHTRSLWSARSFPVFDMIHGDRIHELIHIATNHMGIW